MTSRVQFLKTAVDESTYPLHDFPEVAFVGRSNAGKSTLINTLLQQQIAKTSSSPGKTRALQFFLKDKEWVLCDVPGYGWAKRTQDEITSWRGMVETYLRVRKNLKGVVLVVDSRRKWDQDEEALAEFLSHHGVPLVVALSKMDQLLKSKRMEAVHRMELASAAEAVFPVAKDMKQEAQLLSKFIYKNWIKP